MEKNNDNKGVEEKRREKSNWSINGNFRFGAGLLMVIGIIFSYQPAVFGEVRTILGDIKLSVERWIETSGGIGGICLSPDGLRIYAAYWGNERGSPIEEYDIKSGQLLRTFSFDNYHCHGDVVISKNGRFIYTPNYYYTHVSRLDLTRDGEEEAVEVGGVKTAVWAGDIDMAPDGQLICVAVGRDGRNYDMKNDQISIMNVSNNTFELLAEIKLPDEPRGHKLGFTQDSHFVYVVTYPRQSTNPRLYEISLKPPYKVTRWLEFPEKADLVGVAVCDAVGKIYVSDSVGKKIWNVSLKNFDAVSAVALEGAAPGTIKVSYDGKVLYVLSPTTRSVWAIDTRTNHILGQLRGLSKAPEDIEVSPDGTLLFISHRGEDGGICMVSTRKSFK